MPMNGIADDQVRTIDCTTLERLYHGTSFSRLIGIIGKNLIWGNDDDNGMAGTFTSGELEVAARYVGDNDWGDYHGGVIALDANALLRAGYGITPSLYHSGDDGIEFVVDTVTENLKPALDYVLEIAITHENHARAMAALEGNPLAFFDCDEWGGDEDRYLRAVEAVRAFPFRLVEGFGADVEAGASPAP